MNLEALCDGMGIAVGRRWPARERLRRSDVMEIAGVLSSGMSAVRALDTVSVRANEYLWRLGTIWSWLLEAWDKKHPGEISHQKVALRQYRFDADRPWRVVCSLQPTEWRQARAAQEYLTRLDRGDVIAANWRQQHYSGIGIFPNLLAVHCIVETADECLLITRRTSSTPFYPLHWSASMEEGVEPSDLTAGDEVFEHATRRGLAEELVGTDLSDDIEPVPLGLVIELPTGSPSVVLYARLPITTLELAERRLTAVDGSEADDSRIVPFTVDSLVRILRHGTARSGDEASAFRWHPTSSYRILAAMVYRFGWPASATALGLGT